MKEAAAGAREGREQSWGKTVRTGAWDEEQRHCKGSRHVSHAALPGQFLCTHANHLSPYLLICHLWKQNLIASFLIAFLVVF